MDDSELVFAKAILKHGNKAIAYKSAHPNWNGEGTKPWEYYKRSRIQAYLKESAHMAAEKTVVDREWVLKQLEENAQMAREGIETETTTYKDGEEVSKTVSKRKEIANANKATELIGKELGMFKDTVNITGLKEVVQGLKDDGDALADQLNGPETDDTDAE